MAGTGWLEADEAARRLGVKPATLYAYVSRGQLRRRTAADGRRSEYHPQDVADLAVRGRRARPTRPSDIIVPTAVTRIDRDGPHYRGRSAVELAGRVPFEAVAELLWDVRPARSHAEPPTWATTNQELAAARSSVEALGTATSPADRLLPAVAAVRSVDPLRRELQPEVVVSAVRRLLATLAALVGERPADDDASIAGHLASRYGSPGGGAGSSTVRLVDAALVLLADHELAASTLAVRVAASARCDPYAAIEAGLAVLSGRRHGAASRPLEVALVEVAAGSDPAAALERGAAAVIPGFGLPLYPDGDPRAGRLLELLDRTGHERLAPLHAVLEVARSRGLPPPTIDAALAGLTHVLGAPPGTGELLFAMARIAGWTAHALEQYEEARLLRPRAVYVGR